MKKKITLLLTVVALIVCMTVALVGCSSTDVKSIDEMVEKINSAKSIAIAMNLNGNILGTETKTEMVAKYSEKAIYIKAMGTEAYYELVDGKYDRYEKKGEGEWVFKKTETMEEVGGLDSKVINEFLGENILKSENFEYSKEAKAFVIKDVTTLGGTLAIFANEDAYMNLVIKGSKMIFTAGIDVEGQKANLTLTIDGLNSTSVAKPTGLPKKA